MRYTSDRLADFVVGEVSCTPSAITEELLVDITFAGEVEIMLIVPYPQLAT
ncbi:hypothetical protein J5U21_02019 [Saccharolobus shibatae]|uniref:Uncharacterized protein n=2 Tax=Saccharolobus shibatae TaxID=2286 RepID=A0A8F5GWN9_9CREN|nr:hypothetical protein J5U21_02019 [Saccharolobus shibatae]